jgi:hypothetical protein
VRSDDNLHARRACGAQQFKNVLVQPDGLGNLSDQGVDLAIGGEEVVVRIDEEKRGPGGVMGVCHGISLGTAAGAYQWPGCR